MSKNEKKKSTTFRNFCFIAYYEDFIDQFDPPIENSKQLANSLGELGLAGCVSPLHEPDNIDVKEDGNITEEEHLPKKHWHVLLSFKGRRKLESVQFILEPLGIKPHLVKTCGDVTAYARYMLHEDHPEKQQFEEKNLFDFGWFDSRDKIIEESDIVRTVFTIINEKNITTYRWLLDYLLSNDFPFVVVKYVMARPYLFNIYTRDNGYTETERERRV